MTFALSTNWCNRRLADAAAIVDEALSLGFDALELGYATPEPQAKAFAALASRVKISSVHAFCPVPISAPHAHPELYTLASTDREARSLAVLMAKRSIETAAETGADTLVVHAGRVSFSSFLSPLDSSTLKTALTAAAGDIRDRGYMKKLSLAKKRRADRAAGIRDAFRAAFSELLPCLEKNSVTLALENLPYLEAFPDEGEMASLLEEFKGAPLASWFDTGHHAIRNSFGWLRPGSCFASEIPHRGLHLNDVAGLNDDHFEPGGGSVDFAALKTTAREAGRIVFEPSPSVPREALAASLAHIRALWA